MAETQATEYEAINTAVIELRTLSIKYNMPVIVICERNRTSMKEGGLSAVAGSRAVEYRSDVVLSLDYAKDEDEDEDDPVLIDPTLPREITLTVLKNRNGPNGSVLRYTFDGDYQSWSEL
jgi:replicative DNA helicase